MILTAFSFIIMILVSSTKVNQSFLYIYEYIIYSSIIYSKYLIFQTIQFLLEAIIHLMKTKTILFFFSK